MNDPEPACRPALQSVSVEMPEGLLGPTPDQVALCLKQLALIELFRRGEISSGKGAEVLGIGRWDFIRLLGEHEIPFIDLSEEEFHRDLEAGCSHWGREDQEHQVLPPRTP